MISSKSIINLRQHDIDTFIKEQCKILNLPDNLKIQSSLSNCFNRIENTIFYNLNEPNLQELKNSIYHEMIHALDYNNLSQDIKEFINDKNNYTSPTFIGWSIHSEFRAYFSSLELFPSENLNSKSNFSEIENVLYFYTNKGLNYDNIDKFTRIEYFITTVSHIIEYLYKIDTGKEVNNFSQKFQNLLKLCLNYRNRLLSSQQYSTFFFEFVDELFCIFPYLNKNNLYNFLSINTY